MNIEHKIREILREQPDGKLLTAKEIFDVGQFENLTVIQAQLQKMASKPASGISREKIKNPEKGGLREIWAYFSLDKNATPAQQSVYSGPGPSARVNEKPEIECKVNLTKAHPLQEMRHSEPTVNLLEEANVAHLREDQNTAVSRKSGWLRVQAKNSTSRVLMISNRSTRPWKLPGCLPENILARFSKFGKPGLCVVFGPESKSRRSLNDN